MPSWGYLCAGLGELLRCARRLLSDSHPPRRISIIERSRSGPHHYRKQRIELEQKHVLAPRVVRGEDANHAQLAIMCLLAQLYFEVARFGLARL